MIWQEFLSKDTGTQCATQILSVFFCKNEHKHMHDRSMLVLYLAFCSCQQCRQFVRALAHLSTPSRNPIHALGIPIVSTTPCLWISSSKTSPSPQNYKKPHVVKVWILSGITHCILLCIVLFRFYYFMSSVAATCTRNICCSKNRALQLRCCT